MKTPKQAQLEQKTLAAHYSQLLGIEAPWQVISAELDLLRGKVVIAVGWDELVLVTCPECGQACARHDHAPEREWRHLNVMEFVTVIRGRKQKGSGRVSGFLGQFSWLY